MVQLSQIVLCSKPTRIRVIGRVHCLSLSKANIHFVGCFILIFIVRHTTVIAYFAAFACPWLSLTARYGSPPPWQNETN